mmetsp:Transcript_30472/g.73097  ORF Transcript_30472/g.73097 Transcript_30472/m.73097 type:complete len:108 (+) Transcript_30472:3265-3588(+)
MQKQNIGDDDDEKSVEICLDTLTITQTPPPSPKAVPETREKRRTPSQRPIFPRQGGVIGSPGHSNRQLLNEKALEMYSDDESVCSRLSFSLESFYSPSNLGMQNVES